MLEIYGKNGTGNNFNQISIKETPVIPDSSSLTLMKMIM